jgi:hypothetical protein
MTVTAPATTQSARPPPNRPSSSPYFPPTGRNEKPVLCKESANSRVVICAAETLPRLPECRRTETARSKARPQQGFPLPKEFACVTNSAVRRCIAVAL